jgi:hypothetical protein
MILAWRRFRPSGAVLAVVGFAVTLVSPLAREIVRTTVLDQDHDFAATDISLILNAVGVVSSIGFIVVVFAIRRMITSAEAATASQPAAGDRL